MADKITSILLIALSGLWIYWSQKLPFPKFAQVTKMGPGDFPTMVAVILGVCAIWLFVDTLRRPVDKTEDREDKPKSNNNPQAIRDITVGFGLFTLLLVLLPFAGFSAASCVFVFLFLHFIGRYKFYISLIIALVIPFLLWFIFAYLLTVPLPKGLWGF